MSGSIMAGMVATSHNGSLMGSATFDTVNFSNTSPPPPGCVTGWTCQDLGAPLLAARQSFRRSTWSLQGAGGAIWGTSGQFPFLSRPLAADRSAMAHDTA